MPEFGCPIPTIRIHAHKEPEIVQALTEMDAEDRKCGDKPMRARVMQTENIPDQQTMFGQKLPEAENINDVNLSGKVNEPFFDLVSATPEAFDPTTIPARPSGINHDNDNIPKPVLKTA